MRTRETTRNAASPAGGERATNGRGARAAAKVGAVLVVALILFGAPSAMPAASRTESIARCTALTN